MSGVGPAIMMLSLMKSRRTKLWSPWVEEPAGRTVPSNWPTGVYRSGKGAKGLKEVSYKLLTLRLDGP